MTCISAQGGACSCGCTAAFPQAICNAPGLPAISYRVGDYLAFRHRLLQSLPGEQELTEWQPGATGDLAVQLLEWWAYLADILTFYNERYANEAYLGTAIQPASVNHLVQLLGYRPRPALGAKGTLAALLTSTARLPVTLPQGMQIQSKPGPGQSPQVFELDQTVQIGAPDIVSAQAVPTSLPLLGSDGSVWLAGKVSGIKPGDTLLLINNAAINSQTIADYAWIGVSAATPTQDPLGNNVTDIAFTTLSGNLTAGAQAGSYLLLKAQQSSPLWPYPTASAIVSDSGPLHYKAMYTLKGGGSSVPKFFDVQGVINLAGLARSLTPGSLFLLDVPTSTGLAPTPLIVASYAELVWYANCGASGDASVSPGTSTTPAIAVLHSQIGVASLSGDWNDNAANVTLRYGFAPVGQLVPVLTSADYLYTGGTTALVPQSGSFPASSVPVLLEDGNLNAAAGAAVPAGTPNGAITVDNFSVPPPAAGLASPISAMFDLLPVSRGKTVASETLGSGNPVTISQDFTLQNAPVTYFADPASISGDGFSSTVKVWVDGVQWQEVQSFYGQAASAQIFVLREDDSGQTHVGFGDGTNGARPPTGTNNIVASYRYGAGEQAPSVETLTVVQTPQPGLKSVRNPLPPIGGADADAPQLLTTLAPRSVLAFNRAVSLDDYAAIALTGGGVTQAIALYGTDPLSQRPVVQVWVAGDNGATAAAQSALNGVAQPGQRFVVDTASPVAVTLSLTFLYDPRYNAATLQSAIATALTGADQSLFGTDGLSIGQAIYDSQIEAACLAVPGVMAIHDLSFATPIPFRFQPLALGLSRARLLRFPILSPAPACTGHQHNPGAGQYFTLSASDLTVTPGASS
jgi:hypothetical protein